MKSESNSNPSSPNPSPTATDASKKANQELSLTEKLDRDTPLLECRKSPVFGKSASSSDKKSNLVSTDGSKSKSANKKKKKDHLTGRLPHILYIGLVVLS